MSKTSYTPVRFEGGPLGGTTKDYLGEPKRTWTPKEGGLGGAYHFEWDREDGGAKLRSGTYTWDADADVAPTDGDSASALMDELGPEEAAKRLNDSASSAVVSSAEGSDDRRSQATGDNASAELAKSEEKAKEREAAQAQAKGSKTSAGYDDDDSGANTVAPKGSSSGTSARKPASK